MARPCMQRSRTRRGWGPGGFSLIEVMVAVVLVGIGVASVMVAMQSGTQVNAAGRDITQAIYLAQEVREWTLKLPFSDTDPGDADNPPGPDGSDPQTFVDDLDDLMNVTYSPPRDASSNAMGELGDWSQHIALSWRDPDDLVTEVAAGSSDCIYVTVTIGRGGRDVLSTGWLVTRRVPQ